MQIEQINLSEIKKYKRNAKEHPQKQIDILKRSLEQFGFVNPILLDAKNEIIAGHGRFEAAKQLGIKDVPCIRVEHLTEEQVKAYRLADNKIAEFGILDKNILEEELSFLDFADFDMDALGFGKDTDVFGTDDAEEMQIGKKQKQPVICPKCGFEL